MNRVRPKRRLAPIQCDVGYPDGQFSTLAGWDAMNGFQRHAQFVRIDLLFRSSLLEAGLRFGHTIFDGFDTVTARECAPRTDPVRFQDDVRVNEHGAMVSRHRTSQVDRMLDTVRREQIRQTFDG